MIRIVILAPALAVRAGLQAMLNAENVSGAGSLQVIAQAASLEDLGPLPEDTDVLLMVPEAAAEAQLRAALLPAPGQVGLLLLSEDREALNNLATLPVRAWGMLSLESSAEELLAAVGAVHEGLLVGTPSLLAPFMPRLLAGEAAPAGTLLEPLTERETQVLQLLAQGLANKQIAVALGISEHTVKFHVSSVYSKLGATNRTEAVRLGVQSGLILL